MRRVQEVKGPGETNLPKTQAFALSWGALTLLRSPPDSALSHRDVRGVQLDADELPAQTVRDEPCGPGSHERVENGAR